MYRLLVLLVCGLFLSACSVQYPGTTKAGAYSGAFWFWINESMALRAEYDASQEPAEPEALAALLEHLRTRQDLLNESLRAAVPPARWSSAHPRIIAALDRYAAAAARLTTEEEAPTADDLARLAEEQRALRQRVSTCYARADGCS